MGKNSKQRNYLSFLLLFGALGGILKTIIEFVAPWLPKLWKKYPRTAKTIKVSSISLLVLIVASVVISGVLPASQPAASTAVSPAVHPPTKTELLTQVNAERAKNGVPPLVEDPRLDASAQMKADDEVTYHYFGHVSPHDGKHGYDYINSVGIYCKTDAENLTENISGHNTTEQAVHSWIQSPKHHAAMIDPDYTLTGFGINGNQISEHFCQP